ncbi:MAG: SDR family NAD(P)-dependent oxidoreductase, partial [Myxococcaceae bacterium]|nr:SDR family NAD(P)-dependent oxidoreductase [Myxococcaceae bacterium]
MNPNGKVVVVTGATSGLGQAFAIEVAKQGARVILVGRDASRASQTEAAVKAAGGEQVEVVLGDVSTVTGVREVAAAIRTKVPRIDVLVNNAGGRFETLSKTKDGVETTFALNTLGAFLLERELHRELAAAKGRVVNLATGFLDSFPVDPAQLTSPEKFTPLGQYGRAKQASVMMTVEQSKRFGGDGITVVSMHPGIILGTRFGGGQGRVMQALAGPIMRGIGMACTLEEAVRRFMVAAFGEVPNGAYLVKGKPAALPKQVNDVAVREQVYGL